MFPTMPDKIPCDSLKTKNKTFVFKTETFIFETKTFIFKNKSFILSFSPAGNKFTSNLKDQYGPPVSGEPPLSERMILKTYSQNNHSIHLFLT